MCKKYLSLFKYELKKLIWLYGAMILFFILYISNESIITANEASSLLTISDYTYITFNILNPKIYFFYIAFVAIMVYIQFNDGFNKLWHSLPFKNIDVIGVKLIVGIITLLLFFTVIAISKITIYFDYADIYKLNLAVANIDPSIISPLFIIKEVIIIFAVYVTIYFFTVLCQYIIGNCISGIVFSGLFISIPTLIIAAFNITANLTYNNLFAICPYFYDLSVNITSNILDTFVNDYIFNLANYEIDLSIFLRFNNFAIVYYGIIAIVTLLILLKISTNHNWIEQSSPFNKKWVSNIFKIVFVIDFAVIGTTFTYNSTFDKIILAIVFAIIGLLVSSIIVKKQGVSK